MTATVDNAVANLQRANAELQRQLDERTAERNEALAREAATAEVLQVINSSPGDLVPVFDAILDKAMRLCGASFGVLGTYDGERFRSATTRNVPAAYAEFRADDTGIYGPGTGPARLLAGEAVVHIPDLPASEPYQRGDPNRRALVDLGGARASLIVPLLHDAAVVGYIMIYRKEAGPFADKQIALLQNFAAQAVIAMDNARLLGELQQRTGDLQESLEYQTAISDVLKVISSSTFDLDSVLQTVVAAAHRLCRSNFSVIFRKDGAEYRWAAGYGISAEYEERERRAVIRPGPGTIIGRAVLAGHAVQIADARTDPLYEGEAEQDARTMLGVPLLRDGGAIGGIGLARNRVEAFTDREVELVTTFADQAAIAIENARLLSELRERTSDLEELLEYQTATSDVLRVISGASFDIQPVFETIVETAARLCDANFALITNREGEAYRQVATFSATPEYEAAFQGRLLPVSRASMTGRTVLEGRVVHIPDITADPEYDMPDDVRLGKVRALLAVPLLREGVVVGTINLARTRVEPFLDRQIDLVRTFADQAVIAMENARLITETREARDDAEAALRDLKAAQANLIQAEKMASLGQLTAGIAHEIKNPLNFVNNFAGLSVELLDELKESAAPALDTLGEEQRVEIDETIEMLTGNLGKIAEHGKRADNIVKSMLEHSRGVSGERRAVDLNGLIEEALNLAYHGARAQDQSFNITLEHDYAPKLKPIELAPQEMTRVFLNLFGNGFYAANKRARETGGGAFRPTLRVATRDLGDSVEVRVHDNGTGIPPDIEDKLFQPFFTTKPTGEGTGLGLSISYDIITQQHGGTLTVESEPGAFTEFTVRLPRQ
jgi:two-component system, NtrC family, sensor kinase